MLFFFFFFFQAEDGIRDFHVTGVQTCALPISEEARPHRLEREDEGDPGGADAPLRPDLDQVAERARKDARDDQGPPHRPAARHRKLAEPQRNEQKAEERAVTAIRRRSGIKRRCARSPRASAYG